jgi:uncharacterized membrane protein YfcA
MGVFVIGAILFLIIGIVLSLIGSGGAILTIPVLVYIFDIDPYWATSYSMFIMGMSNWAATIDNIKRKDIFYKLGLHFAIPALMVTYIIRGYVLPVIPQVIIENSYILISKDNAIMLIFSVLILTAAIKTLKSKEIEPNDSIGNHYPKNVLQGAGIGLVTGFVGAGGGFLIVPALIFTSGIQLSKAIATSLFVISITTTLGFLGDFNSTIEINWRLLAFCTSCSVFGVIIANAIKDRIGNKSLKLFFGYFILALGLLVFFIEINKLNFKI